MAGMMGEQGKQYVASYGFRRAVMSRHRSRSSTSAMTMPTQQLSLPSSDNMCRIFEGFLHYCELYSLLITDYVCGLLQPPAYTAAMMHLEDTAGLCIETHVCTFTEIVYSSAILLIS